MQFDRWVVLFLMRKNPTPDLSESDSDRIQDEHLAYLSKLHDSGSLLAAGPVDRTSGSAVAGICVLPGSEPAARALLEADPAVRAGFYRAETVSWAVPAGTVRFLPSRFPRSMSEAGSE